MKHISVVGYGSVGQKLAKLFNDAGRNVTVCSKDASRGAEHYPTATFIEGIQSADAIVLAIPYGAIQTLIESLADELNGKTIIDCCNPLNEDWSPLLLGQETSAAEQIAALAPQAKVVKAFNTIFADVMAREHHDRKGHTITAFISGDDKTSKHGVMSLASDCGFSALDAGPLKSARYLEAMAHLNIEIAVAQGGGTNAAFVYHQA
ncbi:NADPH-dependent F420 reductase [Pseudoteredinibacter isoporae]|uniref:Pyrroline-5-carboxylate reductase catalytic N-terminal domain-containing protein n=1 Tax=Pseudoteredinibacter isoporae TaxID=570281 RepID=A0A7X0MWK3_9GAMM|nr:NAD(P)-binding domain-containing protein [Pseudoteredinibacter isoporae]MBB6521029.1 hypothetical protein [Pseudoteredinibacter isoporae]NHO86593.1 NAD(P)-binding domain-containing protein [Pseudoteredinibacter isoporae]NIB24955.1 NAD(P)-binding domain-containing protein [Pseudoteredinibacter isoporae]